MFRQPWAVWLVALLLLTPNPAAAQSGKHVDADTPSPPAPAPPGQGAPHLAAAETLIVRSTNQFRKEQGRPAVRVNPDLAQAARYFADFMARTDKYGHTADGKQPWDRATEHGYEYCIVLENIAYQYNSEGFTTKGLASGFVTGWQESPGHRKNMLDPDVADTGVAVAHSSKTGRYYAVQMFGRSRAQAIRFRITNATDRELRYWVDGKAVSILPRYTMTHQRCRPPALRFAQVDKGQTFHPRSGNHYTLQQDEAGALTVEQK